MKKVYEEELEESRRKILAAIGSCSDVTFIRHSGNIGDHLIYAGTRKLISEIPYKEISVRQLEEAGGEMALVSGGGSWCKAFHLMPGYMPLIEERFQKVIVLPSSFDVSVVSVKETLKKSKALYFARERVSYRQIRDLCKADLAHDCAFFFDFTPYRKDGSGTLTAFRTEEEARGDLVPPDNQDISLTCETLDEWLWRIARSTVVQTDRAHVTIASALLARISG